MVRKMFYYITQQLLLPLALQPFVDFGFLRQDTLVLRFHSKRCFLGKVAGPTPNLQPGEPVPRIYNPLGLGSPVIPPGTD
jgi:hypothetical protein